MENLRLKAVREEKNLTLQDVADILNIKKSTYEKYELGTSKIKLKSLIILALYYDTSIDYLVCNSDDPIPHGRTCKYENISKLFNQKD